MAGRRARGARPERRPDPEPMEIDESKVVAFGTALWFVAWAGLLILHGRLEDNGNEWWVWTAVAGFGLGLWGWWLTRRRVLARTASRVDAPGPGRRRRRTSDA